MAAQVWPMQLTLVLCQELLEPGESTPRLVIPWSMFQRLVMSRRPLRGLHSWGKVGVIVIRRVAQDILHWAHSKGYIYDPHPGGQCQRPLLLGLGVCAS